MDLLCFVLVAGAAYGLSKHQTKKYTATASLIFNNSQSNQQAAGLQAVERRQPAGRAEHERQAGPAGRHGRKDRESACSGKGGAQLARELTKEKVSKSLSVSAQGESNIVDVSVTAASPELAAEIANTYTKSSSKSSRTATTPTTPPR